MCNPFDFLLYFNCMEFWPTVSGTQTIMNRGMRINFGPQTGYLRVSPHPDGSFDLILPSGVQPSICFEQNFSICCIGEEVAQRVMAKAVTLQQMGLMNPANASIITLYCRDRMISLDPQCHLHFETDPKFIEFLFLVKEKESYDTDEVLKIVGGYNKSTFRTHMSKFNNWMRDNTPLIGGALVGERGSGYHLNSFIRLRYL